MDRLDIIFRIIEILIIGIIPSLLAIYAIRLSISDKNRLIKSEKLIAELREEYHYESKRPQVYLTGFKLFLNSVDTYIGKKIEKFEKGTTSPIDEIVDFEDVILNPNRLRKDTVLQKNTIHKKSSKEYMFINFCDKDTNKANLDNVIFLFDVLNIEFTFEPNRVSEFHIKKAYSMVGKNECFGYDMDLDLKFTVSGRSKLEIPIAYACTIGQETSLILENIHNDSIKARAKTKETNVETIIDFTNTEIEVDKYIRFVESAYLFECITNDVKSETYEYSLFYKIEDGTIKYWQHDGDDLFNSVAKSASERAGEDVIQYSVHLGYIKS